MNIRFYFDLAFVVTGFVFLCPVAQADKSPDNVVSRCEIDLNNDGRPDLVLLTDSGKSRALIVRMATTRSYDAYTVTKDKPNMDLSCCSGASVVETSAGKKGMAGRVYKTPGAYVLLKQPEGSSVAYFWNGKGFTEVWTSD